MGRNPFGIFSQIWGALKPTAIFWSHRKSQKSGENFRKSGQKSGLFLLDISEKDKNIDDYEWGYPEFRFGWFSPAGGEEIEDGLSIIP